MPVVAFFITATKLAGVLVTVTVAANAFSYNRFRKKNLMPIPSSLVDESDDILAVFNVYSSEDGASSAEKEFFFGLATAPAHVEDRLNDAWLEFAEESPCVKPESGQSLQQADAFLASATGDGGSQQGSLPSREANRSRKRRKQLKIAIEAKIRGFEKYEELEEPESPKECHHNVASWHNIPHP